MFREVAIATFSAAVIGTGAATLSNAHNAGDPGPAQPAIERAPNPEPAQKSPKRDPEFLALERLGLH
jgi:hypothetical protein